LTASVSTTPNPLWPVATLAILEPSLTRVVMVSGIESALFCPDNPIRALPSEWIQDIDDRADIKPYEQIAERGANEKMFHPGNPGSSVSGEQRLDCRGYR